MLCVDITLQDQDPAAVPFSKSSVRHDSHTFCVCGIGESVKVRVTTLPAGLPVRLSFTSTALDRKTLSHFGRQ